MDAQAQSRLRGAREARVQIQKEMSQLDVQVESLTEDATTKVGSAQDELRDVRKKGRTAYADIARHLLSDPAPWDPGNIDFSAIRTADNAVTERARDVAVAERALASRNDEVYEQGRKGMIQLALLALVIVIVLIVAAAT